jgi:uncharacterized protein (TIGR02757 family)
MSIRVYHKALEELYRRYNRREFVHPDPLEFLYRYDDPGDREVAGLVAATLAVGRVASILKSVGRVLELLGPHPAAFLRDAREDALRRALAGFRHRFLAGDNVAAMLWGVRRIRMRYAALGAFFRAAMQPEDETVLPAISVLVCEISSMGDCGRLLADPRDKSACKRLNLYLRWMVRRDDVDPGGWEGVRPAQLVVPLDVHMHRIGRALGLTQRRQADCRTALEVTEAFRKISPADPVKYDFALTRLGIRDDTNLDAFLASCGIGPTAPSGFPAR